MGSGEVDKCMMLGREISALQILNDKQKKQIDSLTADKDSIEVNLKFFKTTLAETEARHKDQLNKILLEQDKSNSQNASYSINIEKSKKESLQLQKDLIKLSEVTELKSREITSLQQRIEGHKYEIAMEREE